MPGATGLSLTCMPVGKPSLIKGRWQASFKYVCVLSCKKQTQKRIYKGPQSFTSLRRPLMGLAAEVQGNIGSSCQEPSMQSAGE